MNPHNDTRYYVTLMTGFGAFVIAALVLLNILQPNGVDVQVWNIIAAPATAVITNLVLLISNKSDRKASAEENSQIKQVAAVAAVEANTAAIAAAKAAGTEPPPLTAILIEKEKQP